MNTTSPRVIQINALAVLLMGCIACFEVAAQSSPPRETATPTLNLDDQSITQELVKEEPESHQTEKPTEKLSVAPNQMDDSFAKAERHGIIPTVKEISVPGTPQRVTKVTGAEGSYCVYSPTVARTDGIDPIQYGLNDQVRTCPQ